MILDLDTPGKPVAFEFLNASEVFKLDKITSKTELFSQELQTSSKA